MVMAKAIMYKDQYCEHSGQGQALVKQVGQYCQHSGKEQALVKQVKSKALSVVIREY